jgi:hypothetical protein
MPYLISNPQLYVETYLVNLDGQTTETPANIVDPQAGTKRLYLDVTGVSLGSHHVEIRAKNMWGQSDPVPFDFVKVIPSVPSGIGLSEE